VERVHLKAMQTQSYKSDVTDREWAIVGPLITEPKTNGRQAMISRRRLLDAMFSVAKLAVAGSGCHTTFQLGKR